MNLTVLLLLASAFSAVACRNAVVCPRQETVHPCSCKHVAFGLQVVCSNVNSTTVLKRVFQVFCDYTIDSLVLHGLAFQNLPVPDDLFVGMRVNTLRLEESQMTVQGQAFQGLQQTLQTLNVAKCSLKGGLKNFPLVRLEHLRELSVETSKLTDVGDDWLRNAVPNLKELVFDHNEIAEVGSRAFSQLVHLQQLSLADNRLVSVSRSMFPRPAASLSRIDLSHNELDDLPGDIFADMPSLSEVVLSGNELRTISEKTWADIWSSLKTVLLYENSIVCDDKLHWIRNKRKPSVIGGTCAAPAKLMGKQIVDVLKK